MLNNATQRKYLVRSDKKSLCFLLIKIFCLLKNSNKIGQSTFQPNIKKDLENFIHVFPGIKCIHYFFTKGFCKMLRKAQQGLKYSYLVLIHTV